MLAHIVLHGTDRFKMCCQQFVILFLKSKLAFHHAEVFCQCITLCIHTVSYTHLDPYAKALAGREVWGRKREMQNHEVRGILYAREYDWEGDRPLRLPYHRVIAYSLHVRGFTKHFSSQVKNKGTFLGVVEKIPYLTELGINQIHLMPVYDLSLIHI